MQNILMDAKLIQRFNFLIVVFSQICLILQQFPYYSSWKKTQFYRRHGLMEEASTIETQFFKQDRKIKKNGTTNQEKKRGKLKNWDHKSRE